ncbi:hypothetical protein Lal_00024163, partial [Lupinus albus]
SSLGHLVSVLSSKIGSPCERGEIVKFIADNRQNRLKTTVNRPCLTFEERGSSSAAAGRTAARRDPYLSSALQATRLARFQGRKLAYVKYADVFSGAPMGDCENEKWESFNVVDMYKSFLRGSLYVTPSGLTKFGSLTVESRLLHYVVAYILVQRNTNHAQPITHDLKLMFAIHEGIIVNWPAKILKVMSGIASSSSRLLAYGILISRIIEYMEIETSDVDYQLTNTHDHLEDYRTTIDLELSDEETHTGQPEQPVVQPEASQMSQAPPFGLAHLDAMEQRPRTRLTKSLSCWRLCPISHTLLL